MTVKSEIGRSFSINQLQIRFFIVKHTTMKKNIKDYILTAVAIAVGMFTFLLINCQGHTISKQRAKIEELNNLILKSDTVTEVKTDTLYFTKTIVEKAPKEKQTTIIVHDTLYRQKGDSVEATPILVTLKKKAYRGQKVQDRDTLSYEATVTGRAYEGEPYPSLDSISFALRGFKVNTNILTTIEKPMPKKANKLRLRPSVQLGVGYGFINKKPDVYAGAGITLSY